MYRPRDRDYGGGVSITPHPPCCHPSYCSHHTRSTCHSALATVTVAALVTTALVAVVAAPVAQDAGSATTATEALARASKQAIDSPPAVTMIVAIGDGTRTIVTAPHQVAASASVVTAAMVVVVVRTGPQRLAIAPTAWIVVTTATAKAAPHVVAARHVARQLTQMSPA